MRTFYLLSNRIGPSHQANGELGVGTSMVMKAVQESSPKSSAEIRKLWKSHGDLGDVAFQAKSSQKLLFKPRPLTIRALYDTLVKISLTRGATNKAKMIQSLLASAVGEETRWLCRILIQNIRIGAVRTTVLTAIAHAIEIERPSFEGSMRVRCRKAELAVKEAYVRCADERVVIPVLLRHSVSEVARYCPTRIGIPILPMLGRITRDLLSVLDLMKDRAFLCDFKYDGQRAQVHGNIDKNRSVLIFSRHLEDITEQYPDLVQLVQQEYSDAGPFILDCEVVAISDSGEPLPMQILSTRSKKNVSIESIRVKVCLKAFDIMFHEEPLITKSLRERRQRMGEIFREVPGRFNLCECMVIEQNCPDTDRAAKVEGFLRAAIDSGCEGLMVKCLDDYVACVDADIEEGPVLARKGPGSLKKVLLANYEPDKRSESWLKVKKDYVEGMADSFDVVPIGAWWGMGRKAGWYSPILMAVWNPYLGMYETLCKCMSGFTDEFYKEFTASQTTLPEKPSDYRVGDSLVASVWFPPSEVWEIRGADLTASTAHTADKAEDGCDRGISLRFPRFVRKRPDKKTPDGVTTSFAVREMFDSQISRRREC